MRKRLVIISIGLITGVVAYVLLNKRVKTDAEIQQNKGDSDILFKKNVSIVELNNIHSNNCDYSNAKSLTLSTVSNRHKEASKIMKDTVEIICKRSELSEDENYELEKISDELDKLLREEQR